MRIIETIKELRLALSEQKKAGKSIGLVPTMGYLHEGHLTLAKNAKDENDIVVMSIFVNPTQFGPNEDFESYPRDLQRDAELAKSVGVDFIFAPSVEEMYPTDGGIRIQAGRQATILCGASRPGHFDGVLQVVAKLFHIVGPNRAYFGQKDAQQLAIISTMVRDYNFPLEVRSVPIVREESGLAKSSRNVYLSDQEKTNAVALYEGLQAVKNTVLQGGNIDYVIEQAIQVMEQKTGGKVDYFECLSYPDLMPVDEHTTEVLLATAVYVGKTRLIDNVMFNLKEIKAHV